MALATRQRQKLYTRLAPMVGEEEAETLLDQFPSTADSELATIADLKAVEARLDARIDLVEARLTATIEGVELRLGKLIVSKMRTQTILMFTTIVAVLGLAACTSIFG